MIRWSMLLLMAPLSVLAETSVYTEQGIVSESQTAKEVTDFLLDKVRQDALNKTGVYIKKSSTMDASQNLLESTTVTMARLIKIDKYTTSLTPGNGSVPFQNMILTATVSVDDNELKNLVSKEHDLNIVRRQNAALRNQVQDLLRKRAADETSTTIIQAQALTSLPQKPSGDPNITLGDLVADVPMTTPEKPNPGYDQVCRFMKEITNSIVRSSFQNNLTVKLDKISPPTYDKAIADVSIDGNLSWDWSEPAKLMAKFFGDVVTIKGNILTFQGDKLRDNGQAQYYTDVYNAGNNCMGQIKLFAVFADNQIARIDNMDGNVMYFPDEYERYKIALSEEKNNPSNFVLYYKGNKHLHRTASFVVAVNGDDENEKNIVQIVIDSKTQFDHNQDLQKKREKTVAYWNNGEKIAKERQAEQVAKMGPAPSRTEQFIKQNCGNILIWPLFYKTCSPIFEEQAKELKAEKEMQKAYIQYQMRRQQDNPPPYYP